MATSVRTERRGLALPDSSPARAGATSLAVRGRRREAIVDWRLVVKRMLDVTGAVVLLVMSAPIFLLVGLAVRFTSRGPIFFIQERIGLDRRPFRMVKFRTMQHGSSDAKHREHVKRQINGTHESLAAESRDGSFKLCEDPRLTVVGRVLRGTSVDELPQLLNVLRGEMSLVGPRPPLAYELEHYEPWQFERLTVKPGMTGLWQVSGRSRLSYHRMCELDVEYARRHSLRLDVWILLRTPFVVLFNFGSAK